MSDLNPTLKDAVARDIRQAIIQNRDALRHVNELKAVMEGVKSRGEDLKPFRPSMLRACSRAYDARGHAIQAILAHPLSPGGGTPGTPFGVLYDRRLYIACQSPDGGEDNWLLIELDVDHGMADVDEQDRAEDAEGEDRLDAMLDCAAECL